MHIAFQLVLTSLTLKTFGKFQLDFEWFHLVDGSMLSVAVLLEAEPSLLSQIVLQPLADFFFIAVFSFMHLPISAQRKKHDAATIMFHSGVDL